jgi:esterase
MHPVARNATTCGLGLHPRETPITTDPMNSTHAATNMLHHQLVHATAHTPTRWMGFLHGILGSGMNWRSIAREWTEAQPEWGAVLIDLREHGRSLHMAPPHTLQRAAEDLSRLHAHLHRHSGVKMDAILGHSFGGKVALEWVRQLDGAIDHAWIIDSMTKRNPHGEGSEDVLRVMAMLQQMPEQGFSTRDAFRAHVIEQGYSLAMAQWLATQVERTDDDHGHPRYRFALDLDAVRSLLEDYFHLDRWQVMTDPPGRVHVHLVVGGASTVFSPAELEAAHNAAKQSSGRLDVHVIAHASHWVHADAPHELVALIATGMT